MDSAEWAAETLEGWGLMNAGPKRWGPFGQGWSREYNSVHQTKPQDDQLVGVPLGWSPMTAGKLKGRPMLVPIKRDRRPYRDEQAVDE